jgi:hypothetical protein
MKILSITFTGGEKAFKSQSQQIVKIFIVIYKKKKNQKKTYRVCSARLVTIVYSPK